MGNLTCDLQNIYLSTACVTVRCIHKTILITLTFIMSVIVTTELRQSGVIVNLLFSKLQFHFCQFGSQN